MSSTVALVDDDQNILASVSMALESEGFAIQTYSNGESALRGLARNPADVALLDIKMPRMDGLQLLTELRRGSEVPVIFLTSKDEEVDERLMLRMGADDYITKPFSHRLLVERIRAVLRRNAPEAGDKPEEAITRGALTMNFSQHRCFWNGDEVALTVTEFLLLKALAARPGHVKSRDQLMDAAYGDQIYVDDRTIDSHVKRLRKKFRAVDVAFLQIETLYGVGYRYRE